MFIRVKTTPNSPRKSVQIVESFREGRKVRQRIVRHVGIAMDADEEASMFRVKAGFGVFSAVSGDPCPGFPHPVHSPVRIRATVRAGGNPPVAGTRPVH